MGRTILYLVLLLVLGFGVYYFLFSNKENPYGNNEAGFNIKDTTAIGKIFIAGNDNSSITIERSNKGWIVDKQYKALPSALNMLLKTLYQQQPVYPVPQTMRDNVIKYMAGTSIKVELYDRIGKKMRTFYVGNEALNHEGTYMVMEGAHNPYIVQIPGFPGYLTPRYSPYLKDWRDRTVFNIPPGQVKSIAVQYYQRPINSFTLTQDNGKVNVTTDSNIIKANKYNDRRAGVYIKYFQNVNCEGYITGEEGLDTILRMMPKLCSIDVVNKQGNDQHVDVYWMPVNRRSKNLQSSDPNTPDDYDADRYYAVMNNNKDTAVIQRFVFEKIFRNGYEFYQPDELVQPQEATRHSVPMQSVHDRTGPAAKKN